MNVARVARQLSFSAAARTRNLTALNVGAKNRLGITDDAATVTRIGQTFVECRPTPVRGLDPRPVGLNR
jgi:hypothetical protein